MDRPSIPIIPVPPRHALDGGTLVHPPSAAASGAAVADQYDRPLRDLRISVTDRCNFRCVYCMPRAHFGRGHAFLARAEILDFDEILRVARLGVALGVRKIRLTGGEPLLRRDLDRLVAMLATLPVELTLTTNGALLARQAQALRSAGLDRLTVSLDALDDARFRAINDADFRVADVLAGIDAAAAAGFAPIKINMVVQRGRNDADIVPMAAHFRGSGHILRFIEYMDVGATNGWRLDQVVPVAEVVRRIEARWPLAPLDENYRGEVARRWRYRDGAGEIGMIASVTQPFCGDCTRLRLSPDGHLFACLFAGRGHALKPLLRGAADDRMLTAAIAGLWRARSDRYSERRSAATAGLDKVEMSYIGG